MYFLLIICIFFGFSNDMINRLSVHYIETNLQFLLSSTAEHTDLIRHNSVQVNYYSFDSSFFTASVYTRMGESRYLLMNRVTE